MEIDSIDAEQKRQPQKRKKSEDIYEPVSDRGPDILHDERSELIASPDIPPAVYFGPRLTLANRTCWYMGFFLIALGAVGFAAPVVWEFHFGYIHNMINLLAGVVTMWMGLTKKGPTAKRFSICLGTAYLLFGVSGFIFGTHIITSGAVESRYFMTWVPGSAEFGRWDHYLHALCGAILLAGGVMSRTKRTLNEAEAKRSLT